MATRKPEKSPKQETPKKAAKGPGRSAKAAEPAGSPAAAPAKEPARPGERERRIGALLGSAVGDALGLPFAGMYPEEIEDEWGIVTEIEVGEGEGATQGGDYTSLLLVTLESLGACGRLDEADLIRRLVAWSDRSKSRNTSTWKAAARWKEGEPPAECPVDTPTAGAAIRVMPYGALFSGDDAVDLEGDAAQAAALTHVHSSSVAAAVSLAYTVHGLATGRIDCDDPGAFLEAVGVHASAYDAELGEKIAALPNLLDLEVDEGLRYISTSYDATEVYPAALYCFAKSPKDFERTLIAAVNAGLATDALGFLAGALSGAANGLAAIPERWSRRVALFGRTGDLARAALARP